MTPFILALLAPVAGVLLYVWLHNRPHTMRMIDTIVFVALPLLVAWQIFPHVWLERQITPLLAVIAGGGVLYLIEKISHRMAQHTDNLTILLGVASMVLHALLEGGALTPPWRALLSPSPSSCIGSPWGCSSGGCSSLGMVSSWPLAGSAPSSWRR